MRIFNVKRFLLERTFNESDYLLARAYVMSIHDKILPIPLLVLCKIFPFCVSV